MTPALWDLEILRDWERSGADVSDAFRRTKMVIFDHKPIRHDRWYPDPDARFLEAGARKHV